MMAESETNVGGVGEEVFPMFFVRESTTPAIILGEDEWRYTAFAFSREQAEEWAQRIERKTVIAAMTPEGDLSPEEANRRVTVTRVVSGYQLLRTEGHEALGRALEEAMMSYTMAVRILQLDARQG
jgi:hypothetical protein